MCVCDRERDPSTVCVLCVHERTRVRTYAYLRSESWLCCTKESVSERLCVRARASAVETHPQNPSSAYADRRMQTCIPTQRVRELAGGREVGREAGREGDRERQRERVYKEPLCYAHIFFCKFS